MELPSLLGTVFVIFFTGLSGIVFNYKNFLVTLMCVEAMYLGAVSSFAIYGATFRDPSAAINALLVLIFGACKLTSRSDLLVAAYRFVHRIDFIYLVIVLSIGIMLTVESTLVLPTDIELPAKANELFG
jgi:NADH:ubiquinone oxidoreductase subunit K